MSATPNPMKLVEVRRYRWRDAETATYGGYGYGGALPKADDPATVVADLVTRIETLQSAERAIVVSVDGSHVILSTRVPVPAPPPPPSLDIKIGASGGDAIKAAVQKMREDIESATRKIIVKRPTRKATPKRARKRSGRKA